MLWKFNGSMRYGFDLGVYIYIYMNINSNLDKLEYVVCIEDSHLTTSINGFDLANELCAP